MSKYNRKLIGLEHKTFKKNIQWALDQDYYHKLSPGEKEWMSRFNNEYYAGMVKKGDPDNLHQSDELRRACYNANNASNRDVYGIYDSGKAILKVEPEVLAELTSK